MFFKEKSPPEDDRVELKHVGCYCTNVSNYIIRRHYFVEPVLKDVGNVSLFHHYFLSLNLMFSWCNETEGQLTSDAVV
jgi:hypothetical protein